MFHQAHDLFAKVWSSFPNRFHRKNRRDDVILFINEIRSRKVTTPAAKCSNRYLREIIFRKKNLCFLKLVAFLILLLCFYPLLTRILDYLEKIAMSTFLITGGAGFIGSNIARHLVSIGHKVRIIDDLSTGKFSNLNDIKSDIDFIKGDITSLKICHKACADIQFILHHAAIASVQLSIENPMLTNNVNIVGTLNMLEAAKNAKVERFVFASSSSVYGNEPTKAKSEEMIPRPLSPYALQKLTGEYYCKLYSDLYGLSTVSLRYFNVFGPHQDPNSIYSAVIPKFIVAMLNENRPTIFGDGLTSRDFIFIDNVISANLLACSAHPNRVSGRVINIASGAAISLNQLVETINAVLQKTIEPVYGNERHGDVKHSIADIALAKDCIGYEPKVNFLEGLRKTINYYNHNS